MSDITLRGTKGSPLTNQEVDDNFDNLNTDKLQSGDTAASLTISSADINGGTIDNAVIGGTTAAAGSFTTISASGEIAANGGIALGDSDIAKFGAGNDLQIYHDGTHSYVSDQGTGSLRILAENFQVRNPANNEAMIIAIPDSGVTLYHDNLLKLATTATGIDVTGSVVADGLTVNSGATSTTVNFGNSGTPYATWYNDTNGVSILSADAGNTGVSTRLQFNVGGVPALRINEGNDLYLYEDTGVTPKLVWDASAESLGIGTISPSGALDIGGQHVLNDNYDALGASFTRNGTYGSVLSLGRQGVSSGVTLDYPADATFALSTNGLERLRINSAGNVGIGENNPLGLLHLRGDTNSNGAELFLQVNNNNTTDNLGAIHFGNNIDKTLNTILGGTSGANNTSYLTFSTSNAGTLSEAMRIDASGNFLVGKSVADLGVTAGIELNGQYDVGYFTRNAEKALVVNRLTSDGTIAEFRKGGTAVGSIGTNSNTIYIDGSAANTGLQFAGSTIAPRDSGALSDAGVDLGTGSFRFKDLYLSGFAFVDTQIAATNGSATVPAYGFSSDSNTGMYRATTDTLAFSTAGSERARIDAAGNFLLGKSAVDAGATAGFEFRQDLNGLTYLARAGSAIILNRLSSDGDIALFRKDGTTVGSIFNSGTTMGVGSLDTGVLLANNIDAILPWNASTNAERGSVIDLGRATTGQFKNLYLSGTASMGGLTVDGTAPNVVIQGLAATDASLTLSSSGITAWALRTESTDSSFYFTQDGTTRAKLSSGGDISFYEDTGVTPKLVWSAASEKLTLSGTGGIDVSGTVVADGLTVSGPSVVATINAASTNSGLQFTHDATNAGVRDWSIRSNSNTFGDFIIKRESAYGSGIDTTTMALSSNGDISFYEDTGTTPKLVWSAAGEDLNFADNVKATFGASDDLQIYHDGSNSYIKDAGTGGLRLLADADTAIRSADNSTPKAIFGGDVKLYHSGNLKLATTATGIDVTGAITTTAAAGNHTVFNSTGADADFRVRTGANTHSLYVEGNTGNVAIGTSAPLGKVHIETQPSGAGITPSANGDELVLENNSNCGLTIGTENLASIFFGKAADSDIGGIGYLMSDNSMRFTTNAVERMRIDASGNAGLGVVPSAWRSGAKAFQSGGNKLVSLWEQANGSVNLGFAVYESASNVFNYTTTGDSPTLYSQLTGAHKWYTAPAGTAGNPITWTEAMTLDASGNLLVSGKVQASYIYRSGADGSGLHFTTNAIYPTNESASISDGTESLGAAGYRFKDLYLSGGVYLGGTGAANKLDDYEAGTWTPTVGGTWTTSPTTLLGTYIKVGSLVYVKVQFLGGEKSSAVAGWIDGLPFNQAGGGATGSVSDGGVGDKGNCLFANTTRIWLTATSFSGTTYLSGCYNTDA